MRLRKCLIGCSILLCLLIVLSGCEKDIASEQVIDAISERTGSGVAVRIPSTQYRLTRTEPEGAGYGSILLPHVGGAVLVGETFTQEETETVRSSSAVRYSQDRTSTVQALPVSADGILIRAALEDDQLLYLEQTGDEQWILHNGDAEASLDDVLTGCSYISAMAVRNGAVYFAADAAWMIACKPDGKLLWKQAAPEINSFLPRRTGVCWRGPDRSRRSMRLKTIRFKRSVRCLRSSAPAQSSSILEKTHPMTVSSARAMSSSAGRSRTQLSRSCSTAMRSDYMRWTWKRSAG